MEEFKYKIGKIINIGAWFIISVLSLYVMIKSCVVFGVVNFTEIFQKFGHEVVCDFGEKMIYSSSPFFQYVSDDNSTENLMWKKYFNSMFPFEQYVSAEEKVSAYDENEAFSENNEYAENIDIENNTESKIVFYNPNGMILGETFKEKNLNDDKKVVAAMAGNSNIIKSLQENKNFEFLMNNFYIVDSSTKATKSLFPVSKLLNKNMTMESDNSKPQILIFHTHSQEAFIDSKKNKVEDTIVGVGEVLASILTEQYGYNVIHDTTEYDIVNGQLDRNKAYNQSLKGITSILNKNPTIEVVIDLHRDGVSDKTKRVTTIEGKPTAQLMFFNGLSRNSKGPIEYLNNPNQTGNLAFSLQLQIKSMELYPEFTRKIYLKNYRYNLHLREKSLLIELGNNNSTVKEARNAMTPLAKILDEVLQKK